MFGIGEINFLESIFWWLAIVTFVLGLLINHSNILQKIGLGFISSYFRYGRANLNNSNLVKVKLQVPKSWFSHFYLYAVILQMIILYKVLMLYNGNSTGESWLKNFIWLIGGKHREQTVDAGTTLLAVIMFQFQVLRRFYETIFVSIYSSKTKMNIFHYLLAFYHYTASIFTLIAHSPGFTEERFISKDLIPDCWTKLNYIHALGLLTFLYGSYEQYRAHKMFADLRKTKDGKIDYSHKIPRGGLFEQVSCPNYWAEIIIYFSFAVLFKFQNSTWNYTLVWVLVNQVTSGTMNHLWYLEKFPNYPKNRKAVIPLCW